MPFINIQSKYFKFQICLSAEILIRLRKIGYPTFFFFLNYLVYVAVGSC